MPSPFSGWSIDEMAARGAEWTAREIAQQPAVWNEVAALIGQERARVVEFLQPLLAHPAMRIVLTGAGTSAFIGRCLAPALTVHLRRRVEAVATTDIVSGPEACLLPDVPTLLVSFARSGGSPESLAAVELADRCLADAHHLIITCNADGALARQATALRDACVVVLPDATHDRGFAMTSSFTSMLLSCALLFDLFDAESVPGLTVAAAETLDAAVPLARQLAQRGFRRVVYLGSNGLAGLADEAALKLLELSDGQTLAIAQSPLGFRHGPKVIIDPDTLAVVMLSGDTYTRAYDRDLLDELRRDGRAGAVMALDAGGHPGEGLALVLPAPAGTGDIGRVLLYALFAQSFALLNALGFDLRPDQPNAAGMVNRVVRGVTIHPWPAEAADVPGR